MCVDETRYAASLKDGKASPCRIVLLVASLLWPPCSTCAWSTMAAQSVKRATSTSAATRPQPQVGGPSVSGATKLDLGLPNSPARVSTKASACPAQAFRMPGPRTLARKIMKNEVLRIADIYTRHKCCNASTRLGSLQ